MFFSCQSKNVYLLLKLFHKFELLWYFQSRALRVLKMPFFLKDPVKSEILMLADSLYELDDVFSINCLPVSRANTFKEM